MTKKVFITIALALLIGNVNAQQKKSYGIRAGYSSTFMTNGGDKLGSSDNNYFINFYKDTKIFPFLHFQSGLEYSRTGGTIDNFSHYADYLGVPLALKVKVGPLYAFGGGAFNVKLAENDLPDNSAFDGKCKWYDTNAFVGAGIEILILTFDIKYSQGLTNVNNGLKNNGYQASVGIRF